MTDETATDEDALAILMLNKLHEHLPPEQRPVSFSDLSDEQAARARKAVRAVLVASMMSKPDGRFASMVELEAVLNGGGIVRSDRTKASAIETEGGDAEQAPSRSDESAAPAGGDAR